MSLCSTLRDDGQTQAKKQPFVEPTTSSHINPSSVSTFTRLITWSLKGHGIDGVAPQPAKTCQLQVPAAEDDNFKVLFNHISYKIFDYTDLNKWKIRMFGIYSKQTTYANS